MFRTVIVDRLESMKYKQTSRVKSECCKWNCLLGRRIHLLSCNIYFILLEFPHTAYQKEKGKYNTFLQAKSTKSELIMFPWVSCSQRVKGSFQNFKFTDNDFVTKKSACYNRLLVPSVAVSLLEVTVTKS